MFRTEEAKYDAVVEDIAQRHAKGQPILVGTVSVEKSEHLSGKLKARGIPRRRSKTRSRTPSKSSSSSSSMRRAP